MTCIESLVATRPTNTPLPRTSSDVQSLLKIRIPEFERRWSRYARSVHSSWRMDETAVSVRGGTRYLYRAVDKYGKTVDSLLCADRSELSARKFFTKALKTHHPRWPTKLDLDGNAASHRALFSRLGQVTPQVSS